MGWIYPLYVLDLALLVALSMWLGKLVDDLDKKTKISGAFLGGVLLAAVTSLPELFTSLSSIFIVNEPEYVVGDIFGSVAFNLVVLMLESWLFIRGFAKAKIQPFHWINGAICLAMYGLSAYAFFAPVEWQWMMGDINGMSLLIFGLYILSLILQPKQKEEETPKEAEKGGAKKTILWFAFCSVALIGASIALTYLTKLIQIELPALSGSVAGALLLGIGTSIPEVISTAELFKKKNFDAGVGNMVGSCTFDFAVFALGDFLSWHPYNDHVDANGNYLISQRGLFLVSEDAIQLEIFGAGICFIVTAFLLWKACRGWTKKSGVGVVMTSLASLACTGLYLAIFLF